MILYSLMNDGVFILLIIIGIAIVGNIIDSFKNKPKKKRPPKKEYWWEVGKPEETTKEKIQMFLWRCFVWIVFILLILSYFYYPTDLDYGNSGWLRWSKGW